MSDFLPRYVVCYAQGCNKPATKEIYQPVKDAAGNPHRRHNGFFCDDCCVKMLAVYNARPTGA